MPKPRRSFVNPLGRPSLHASLLRRPIVARGFPGDGLMAVYRASEGLYTDTAGTTPCAVAGDVVRCWADTGGVGRDATEAAYAPTLQFEAGVPVVDLPGCRGLTVSDLADGTPSDWSIHWVAKNTGNRVGDNPVAQLCSVAGYDNVFGGNCDRRTGYMSGSPNNYATAGPGWYAVSVCRSNATGKVSVYVDGVLVQRRTAQLALPIDRWRLCYARDTTPNSEVSLVGRVAELAIAHADHGDQAAAVNAYFRSRWGALLAAPSAVVWVGDTISLAAYPGPTTNVPAVACDGLGLSTYYNLAISWSNTADWTYAPGNELMGGWTEPYTNAVRLASARGASKRVVVLWLGAHDIDWHRTPAELLANVQTMTAQALAAGCKVVIGTVIPRGVLGPPETDVLEANRSTYNAALRTWVATQTDVYLADTDTTAINAKPIPEIYSTDSFHLTVAGAAVIAPVFQSAIAAALA